MSHKCEICGKESAKKFSSDNKVVCERHYKQFRKYGKFLDTSSRSINDLNEIRIINGEAFMDLYDKSGNVKATTIFDADDVDKVKNYKWKLSNENYVCRINSDKSVEHFQRVIMGVDTFVSYIDGDSLNNRKCNLRVANKSQIAMSMSSSKGVTKRDDGKYYANIKINQQKYNFMGCDNEIDALWIRWYAERLLFKEFAKQYDEPAIDDNRKAELKQYVDNRLNNVNIKQTEVSLV